MPVMREGNNNTNAQIVACIDCYEESKHELCKYY